MKVNIIGPAFGGSGFCSHVVQLSRSLHEQGVEVRLDSPKPQNWEQIVNDADLIMHSREFDPEMISILIGQAQFLPFTWADNPKTVIPFIIWEGDRIPKYWLEHLLDERIQQIWVPSNHVKEAILFYPEAKVLENKIKIVPHGVDLTVFKPGLQEENDKSQPFNFIANKGWSQGINDRGGIQWLLKAYTEEFTNKDDVELRLKINPSYFQGEFNIHHEMEKLGIEKKNNSPSLSVSTDMVDFKILPQFYEGDVFVSPTMGEAFNLPCGEAQAMGIPVITTNFGGQTDFITDENGWLIDYELVDSKDMIYESVKWGKPNLEQLKKVMRHCYENREEVKEKAKRSLENSRDWSWRNSAKKAIECLKEIK